MPLSPSAFSIARGIAAALLLALALGGCSRKTPAEYVEAARQSYEKRDLARAIIDLKNALEQEPGNGEARYRLGAIYNEMWEGRAAEAELRRAKEAGVHPVEVQIGLARAMLADKRYDKALEEAVVSPALEGDTLAEMLAVRARAHLGRNQLSEAREAVQQALEARGDSPGALVAQALVRMAEQRIPDALALAEDITVRHPKYFEGWFLKGDLLRITSGPEAAIAAYSRAIEIVPAHMFARLHRGMAYLGQRKFKEAKEDIQALRKSHGNLPFANYMLAFAQFQEGKFKEAQANVQLTLKAVPEFTPALVLSGALHRENRSLLSAERDLVQALQREPGNLFARQLLSSVYLDMRNGDRAYAVIEPLVSPDSRDATVLTLAGAAEMLRGNYSQATDLMQRAAAARPDSAESRARLGLTMLQTGQTERGIAELEAATKLDTGKYYTHFMLAIGLIREGKADPGLAAALEAQKKYPDNPVAWNLVGAAYQLKKDLPRAREAYEKALSVQPTYFTAAANLATLDMEAKQPDAARRRFENLLAKDKNHVEAMMALSSIAAREGKAKESADWLERAVKADQAQIEPKVQLAGYYLQAGDSRRALEIAQQAAIRRPNRLDVLEVLGLAQLLSGDANQAITTFTKAVNLAPNRPLTYYRLAAAKAMNSDYQGSEAALAQALALKPDFEVGAETLARLRLGTGKVEDARKLARQMQESNPKSPAGLVMEGDILFREKKYKEALKLYQAGFALNRNTTLMLRVYRAEVRAGNAAAGDALLQGWAREHPDDVRARFFLADAYRQTGNQKGARDELEAIVVKQPKDTTSLAMLAWVYHDLEDRAKSADTAARALKLKPQDPAIIDALGWLMVKQGKPAEAIEILRQAASRRPNAPEIRYHLAAALAGTGDKAAARKEVERALKSGESFREIEEAKALRAKL